MATGGVDLESDTDLVQDQNHRPSVTKKKVRRESLPTRKTRSQKTRTDEDVEARLQAMRLKDIQRRIDEDLQKTEEIARRRQEQQMEAENRRLEEDLRRTEAERRRLEDTVQTAENRVQQFMRNPNVQEEEQQPLPVEERRDETGDEDGSPPGTPVRPPHRQPLHDSHRAVYHHEYTPASGGHRDQSPMRDLDLQYGTLFPEEHHVRVLPTNSPVQVVLNADQFQQMLDSRSQPTLQPRPDIKLFGTTNPLSYERDQDWSLFKQEFLSEMGLGRVSEANQLIYLRRSVPADGRELLAYTQPTSLDRALESLDDLYDPRRNSVDIQAEFLDLKQRADEVVTSYAGRIRHKAALYRQSFPGIMDRDLEPMMIDKLIDSLYDERLQQSMAGKIYYSLDQATEEAKRLEGFYRKRTDRSRKGRNIRKVDKEKEKEVSVSQTEPKQKEDKPQKDNSLTQEVQKLGKEVADLRAATVRYTSSARKEYTKDSKRETSKRGRGSGRGRGRSSRYPKRDIAEIRCWRCDELGHKVFMCPQRPRGPRPPTPDTPEPVTPISPLNQ
jgi:hypothetical protein